jgi:hypothetical protein
MSRFTVCFLAVILLLIVAERTPQVSAQSESDHHLLERQTVALERQAAALTQIARALDRRCR